MLHSSEVVVVVVVVVVCFWTVQHTHTKDTLICAATSPHTDVFELSILTTVTLASTNNALPDDGVTALKHVGVVLVLISM
jgi:hypothetical protein